MERSSELSYEQHECDSIDIMLVRNRRAGIADSKYSRKEVMRRVADIGRITTHLIPTPDWPQSRPKSLRRVGHGGGNRR
jgi:hypothetical protein